MKPAGTKKRWIPGDEGLAVRFSAIPWDALEDIPLAVFQLDPSGRIGCHNESFSNLFQVEKAPLAGRRLEELLAGESAPQIGGTTEVALIGAGGEPRTLNLHLVPTETDHRSDIFAVGLLTDPKRSGPPAFPWLPKPSLFRNLFLQTSFAMATVDRHGRLRLTNLAFRQFLGWSTDLEQGDDFLTAIDGEHGGQIEKWLQDTGRESDPAFNGDLAFRRKDGKKVWGQTTISLLGSGTSGLGRFIVLIQDITERKQAEEEIRRMAYHDALTGLPNRTLLKDRLHQALAQAKRRHGILALFFFDLDRFKRVNDTLGHAAGDLLLQKVVQRLQGCVRQSDTLARLGGDEFVVVLHDLADPDRAPQVATKILNLLAPPFDLSGRKIHVTTSIGIALAPQDGEDADTLMRHADMAMYEAKEQGRNTYRFFSSEMNRRAERLLEIENSLRTALQNNEFELLYQPQLDLDSGRITGIEALLRWHRHQGETLPPDGFLALAQEAGLMLAIDTWVLETACRQAAAWHLQARSPFRVAVNVSERLFCQEGFPDRVADILAQTGLPPDRLEIDITESTLMANVEAAITALARLKGLGVHLAIDDFGTGFSSLSRLKNLPIDRLKIAQAFVQDIDHPDNAGIIDAIVAMARSLGLGLMAEGVETRKQLAYLRQRGCHEMQGFYFSRPLSAGAFSHYLETGLGQPGLCLFDAKG